MPLVPLAVFAHRRFDEPVTGASAKLPPSHSFQILMQPHIAANVTCVHQGRLNHVVAPGVARALRHRPGGVAHGQTGIPQGIEHLFGDKLHVGGGAPTVKEKDVDIRIGVQFVSPVSALGHHRTAPFQRRGTVLIRHLEETLQQAIDHPAVGPHHIRARGPGAMRLQQTLSSEVDIGAHGGAGPGTGDLLVQQPAPGRAAIPGGAFVVRPVRTSGRGHVPAPSLKGRFRLLHGTASSTATSFP